MSLHIVILAAGQGKRMLSSTPKVQHTLGGTPLLERVVSTAKSLNPNKVHVIIGHQANKITGFFSHLDVNWIIQEKQEGTGHAVMQALPHIEDPDAKVLILSGDVPLISAKTLNSLIDRFSTIDNAALGLLVAEVENPFGLGRVLRTQNQEITKIVEERDADAATKAINEIYSGICITHFANLKEWLPKLSNDNAQQEYYLTEIIELAVGRREKIVSIHAEHTYEVEGVNNREQLEHLERIYQENTAKNLMLNGVSIADRKRFDLRGEITAKQDVFIDVNAVFTGKVVLEEGVKIGPNCVIHNATIGANTEIHAHSVLDGVTIGENCQIGPFARLRPETKLSNNCKIGNFVETKKSTFANNSKANHLSYIGDATIGCDVNIGAGTITCNYDGANKHKTIIEDGAFIGSDTQLIAPVTIGKNATIGAGSSIRRNAPPNALTLTSAKQKTIEGWERPKKK